MLGPIFQREWRTLPRRGRHYLMRGAYLGMLWVLGLTAWQALVGWDRPATIGDTSRFGLLLFQFLNYLQLLLLLFFSALSAASAVAQEKDRRTFVLLLTTDLRNYEIVLGKLLGSQLQMVFFLAGMVPVLSMQLLLGGVSGPQVWQATLVLASAALAAGSLGGLVALWRDRTFQALALTVLFLMLYFCLVHLLGLVPVLPGMEEHIAREQVARWQAWFEPFLALRSVVEPNALDAGIVPPAFGFAAVMLALSGLLNGWAVLRLRAWNPSGERPMQREGVDDEALDRAKAHAAPGRARPVWANPILWREIATRAYGRRPLLVKAAYFLVLGLACFYMLGPAFGGAWTAAWGLVPVGILSLLLVSAQAVTAITSERDTGALDLLLVTDLSPREFIFGKLGGVCWNTKEYLILPLVLAGVYAWRGVLASPPPGLMRDVDVYRHLLFLKNLEAFACVGVGTLVLLAFAMVLGLHVALRTENSRLAVVNALGTVFFLSVGTLLCIYLIVINGRFEYQWFSFILFLFAGFAGLWWVLNGNRPTTALSAASLLCPFMVFYSVTNLLIGNPMTHESADPVVPFLVTAGSFGFAIAAMLVPLLSEFDVALGRTAGGGE